MPQWPVEVVVHPRYFVYWPCFNADAVDVTEAKVMGPQVFISPSGLMDKALAS